MSAEQEVVLHVRKRRVVHRRGLDRQSADRTLKRVTCLRMGRRMACHLLHTLLMFDGRLS